MRRRSNSHRRKSWFCHRRKPPSPPHKRAGSHGHSHSRCSYFERSRWRRRPRRDPRCRENWPGRRDRVHAVRQHGRDARNEVEHLQYRAEVRPEHDQEEDRRRRGPEAGHRRRNREGDLRRLAADPEEGRTAQAQHLARRVRPRTSRLPTTSEDLFQMCISFDLEVWSDGDGLRPVACHRRAKRRRRGLQSTIGSGAPASDCAIGALLT